jgi:hypothetical protein
MTLQEFIRDSLLQIANVVADAKKQNVAIAPHAFPANASTDPTLVTIDASTAYPVEFDVAVTVSEKASAGPPVQSRLQACSVQVAKRRIHQSIPRLAA